MTGRTTFQALPVRERPSAEHITAASEFNARRSSVAGGMRLAQISVTAPATAARTIGQTEASSIKGAAPGSAVQPGAEDEGFHPAPLDTVGRRLDYLGGKLARGQLGTVAGHLILGRPYPDAVDFPDGVESQNANMAAGTVVRDQAGRVVSQKAMTMTPPGDCGPGQHKELQRKVDEQCKESGPQNCKRNLPVLDNARRMETARGCAKARDDINSKCFAGGNVSHRNLAIDAWNNVAECEAVIYKINP